MPRRHRTTARSILLALAVSWVFAGTANADVPKRLIFPVVGKVTYTDDFGDARGSRAHQGNDLMAARKAPVVAVERGRVERSPGYDCMLYLYGASGTTYYYVHLNNDLTRRNDNDGGCRNGVSYAPGLRDGQRVRAGQLIGYVGDSGNANGIHPHLHFEIHPNGGRAVSPYPWLKRARRVLFAVPARVESVSLALFGRVNSTDETLSVRFDRVQLSTGWRGRPPARNVALGYAPEVVVERASEVGTFAAATLASAVAGERVIVWTTRFKPTLATQLAKPSVLVARKLRLRGL